jgi:aspartate aminotransferase
MAELVQSLLTQRILLMEESATIKMAQMARDLAAQGHDVIDLSLGEPDFDTPVHIKEAAKKALDDGLTKYTPVPGTVELRKAIQAKFKRDNNLDFELNQIVVSNGAKQSIANVCLSLLEKGDEALILAPYWVSYAEIVKLTEATPVYVYAGIEDDYKSSGFCKLKRPSRTAPSSSFFLRPAIRPVRCTPTKNWKPLLNVLARHEQVTIISDEIYEYINFSGKHASIGAFPQVKDRTVTVNGFSKGFAMTGWRLGYIGAPAWIGKRLQ